MESELADITYFSVGHSDLRSQWQVARLLKRIRRVAFPGPHSKIIHPRIYQTDRLPTQIVALYLWLISRAFPVRSALLAKMGVQRLHACICVSVVSLFARNDGEIGLAIVGRALRDEFLEAQLLDGRRVGALGDVAILRCVSAWGLDDADGVNVRSAFTHMANNLIRRVPGKDSQRLKRMTVAWDDDFLASLIVP
ncbi:hypothetical protein [Bradyrhizobium sp. CCGUVB23]|uniref:hypothetical protein n=1 Tax=Bradyrhizobium sp. CCGUVB23 TaxID=2949630 RepID=UPI0020B420B2|nr:hypothetical protein [Bradyrhizobium sp. CCGUVB23]MCP3468410.1 hypothetical protein [Bradyrhizobium sp. CCGUVB23]